MDTESTAAPITFLFLTANFLIFLGIGTIHPLRRNLPAELLDIIYLCGVPAAYMVGGTHLLRMQWASADGVLAIALALVYVLLYIEARNRIPDDRALTTTALTLAVVFTVLAPALLVDGDALTLAWALEAGALAGIGHHLRRRLLQGLSIPTWIFALGASLVAMMERIQSPEMAVFNARFGTFVAVVVAGATIAELQFRAGDRRPNARAMGELMLWMATPLLLLATSLEVYDFVDLDYWSNDAAMWYIMASVWALIALGLHAFNSRRRLRSTPVLTVTVFGAAILAILIQIGSGGLHEGVAAFGNLRFASVLVTGGAIVAAALLERRWAQGDMLSEDVLWVLGVLVLALAPTVETYVAVNEAATAAPTQAGLLAAATVWAFLSTLTAAIGSDRSMRSMLPLGVAMTVGAIAVTLIVSETVESGLWRPVVNLRILAFVVCIGSLAIESHFIRQVETVEEDEGGIVVGTVLAVFAALLALWPLTKEVHAFFAWSAYPSDEMWRNAAQVGISLSWAVYAIISLAWGMTRRSRIARWLGLIVLAAGVLKLFLWDLSFLEQPYRILSFGVLGLVLIGVAWAYSRYADRISDLT